MARSKFPGKPSKPVNRTRINVLPSGDSEIALASPAVDLLEEDVFNLQTPARSVGKNCNASSDVTKRKSCKVQLDRSSVTKRRCIGNSAHPKARPVRKATVKRSERHSSNRNSIKYNTESNNSVGKFVLPSRSVHSSRVIKPNKRFLNVDAVTSGQLIAVKKRPIYKRKIIEKRDSETLSEPHSLNLESQNVDTGISRIQNSNRRIVLRQARLQLDTIRGKGLEGPFSSNLSPPRTVTCGVCGAVRFYRFVNQARKYNIFSCESCRKFISKMVKRQRCAKISILQCLKGQGGCLIPPILRSQLWKSRCAYKARCNACWLKMCLRSFQMPESLKNGLTGMLPDFMRETNSIFNNSSLFAFHTINPINANGNLQSNLVTKTIPQRVLRRKIDKDLDKSNNIPQVSEIKRQKVDLKGPRVKHVCRSASIVLGQALAVFAENSDKPISEPFVISKTDTTFNNDASENKENDSVRDENYSKPLAKSKCTILETNQNTVVPVALKPVLSKGDVYSTITVSKRDREKFKLQTIPQISYLPEIKASRKPLENVKRICFDFWENYDSDEISLSGFGLISSGSLPLVAVCFLCGSSGQDPLLYCYSCCEPYHPFCLEQAPVDFNPSNQYYEWLCPRCIKCSACGEISKRRINCQKCHKPYHPECFNVEWQSGTRQTVCSACMRCKSCGSSNVTKFIGNTTLCIRCFQLKNKGNYCPLCNKCYEDDDYDVKMMECGKCKMWVHAKCEGLSSEQYQILSTLPDSIEFLCCICESLPHWRKAVDSELRSCFSKILKLLSKNKTARATLKWNPSHFKPPLVKSSVVRRIIFQDNDKGGVLDTNVKEGNEFELNDIEFKSNTVVNIDENDSLPENGDRDILKTPTTPSLTSINNKINCKDFVSISEFNASMKEIITATRSTELLNIYYSILKETVPWFDPTETENSDAEVSFCDTSQIGHIISNDVQDSKYSMMDNIIEDDNRPCVLCKGVGDGLHCQESRLIYCGNNEWVHANCALWSSEVYEEIDGSLQNVHAAIARGRLMSCTHCKLKGASIGCCSRSCHEIYHFPCAYNKQCHFMHDKTFFCHTHYEPGEVLRLSSPSEFVLNRSIYVELDQRKKRCIESKKLQFMVGSLTITCLGVIVPALSDNTEALIPLNFSCRRLFWSAKEPWRLVPYIITTTVPTNEPTAKIVDRNFTVDHTLPKSAISEKLKEIYVWQKDVDTELEDDEEPQNENAPDILSPELTDAILEELPHEFLDRISLQDIFPKLLGNEETVGVDFKLTDMSNSEISINDVNKKMSLVDEGLVFENRTSFKNNSNKLKKIQNCQHSCSVTVSCKVDNSRTVNSKLRSKNKNLYLPLVQVDGAYDNSSSDCESTIQDVEDLYTPKLSDEPVKCQRCGCTYRTEASYTRHLETCDTISMSDSDSEIILENEYVETTIPTCLDNRSPETVTIIQSDCKEPYVVNSYESYTSFQATQNEMHSSTVNTQTFMSSESTAEVLPVAQNELFYSNLQPDMQPKQNTLYSQGTSISSHAFPVTLNQSLNCESSQVTIGTGQTLTFNQHSTNQVLNQHNSLYFSQPNCNQPVTISVVQPTSVPINHTATISLNASTPLHITQPIEMQQAQQLNIHSIPIQQEVTPIINITPQNHITLSTTKLLTNSFVTPTIAVPQNHVARPTVNTVIAQKTIRPRGRPRSLAIKRTRPTVFVPQGNSGSPSVVIHQLPSSNMIPTFLEAFQQQTGQNLQYVSSITPQIAPINNQTQMMQFQPEGTVLNLVSGVQPTVILPQARVLSDQIIMDNNGSLMWSSQPLQTIQPILYGFETIVQNTVLQSQQFLPGTVPGILTANSSFSSTTQVFQTSKLEPVLDVGSGNFVLVNSNPVINTQPTSAHPQVINQMPSAAAVVTETKTTVKNTSVQASVKTVPQNEPKKTVAHASTTTNSNDKASGIDRSSNIRDEISSSSTNSTNTNNSINSSINLPVAPFVPETGIPTNVVTPTPKPISTTAVPSRPMNRVLPMPTKIAIAPSKNVVKNTSELPSMPEKAKTDNENSLKALMEDLVKPTFNPVIVETQVAPVKIMSDKEPSLKLIFQKQSEDGDYKVSRRNLSAKTCLFTESNSKNSVVIESNSLKPVKEKNVLSGDKLQSVEQNAIDKVTINIKHNVKNERSQQKQENTLLYTVETLDGFHYSSTSLSDLWTKVFEAVQAARLAHDMLPLPNNSLNMLNGLQLLGLKANGLKYLLEQLPGASKCTKYKPSFHFKQQDDSDEDDDSIKVDHSQGTRSVAYSRSHDPSDMFGWLASKHRKPIWDYYCDMEENTRRGGSVTNFPIAMRFRSLKLTSKHSVGVYRSKIHKRGLFCHRDIESGEMVIEYAGEVIRSILADKREKQYTTKGMGCYMFRIDENFVVDATMKGNAARFINHSCEPNCYSKVVEVLGHKHIVIFALRKIQRGEELTYDYKFPFEEDKIPCTCGTRRCRKFLN